MYPTAAIPPKLYHSDVLDNKTHLSRS
jgi:hypothetical protein